VILGDPDKCVHVTGCYGQFLEVIHVLVDTIGALEVRVGLKFGEGLVLLVLLQTGGRTWPRIQPRWGMGTEQPMSGAQPTEWPCPST
jgi:hypothetical protein